MTGQETWWEREPMACLTFTLNKTHAQVLLSYGVAPEGAVPLTMQQATAAFDVDTGVILRVGRLGAWTFCHEIGEPEGHKPSALLRLSQDTETILYFRSNGMTQIRHFRRGEEVESFEPGNPRTLRAAGVAPVWDTVHDMCEHPTTRQVIQGLEGYLNAQIDGSLLTGSLATALLLNEDRSPLGVVEATRAAPVSASPRSARGRKLGTFSPQQLVWPPHGRTTDT